MYVVMQIGCLECGIPSKIIGTFPDKQSVLDADMEYFDGFAEDIDEDYGWRGEGMNVAFEIGETT